MRAYKRSDFLKLPEGTIYSRIPGLNDDSYLLTGLYCKESGEEYGNDWVEQDLLGEAGCPEGVTDGFQCGEHFIILRDTFQSFELDYDFAGRDGLFMGDSQLFVVWDVNDITKLINKLNESIKKISQ